jgi:hypothetical protein
MVLAATERQVLQAHHRMAAEAAGGLAVAVVVATVVPVSMVVEAAEVRWV